MAENKKVLLAFSGGIDSSKAAKILISQGHDVTALTLDMIGDDSMLENAEKRAKELGIDFTCIDVKTLFRNKVINYFQTEYLIGRTPAPCTLCNDQIKWKLLFEMSERYGYEHIATGHYFNIISEGGYHYISKALDKTKDQSYYLWMIEQKILGKTLAPMADQIKSQFKNSVSSEKQRESMGVCFLNGTDYPEFIRTDPCLNTPEKFNNTRPGNIENKTGNVIGTHKGIAFYTIGQKKELYGLTSKKYVARIDAERNVIVAGEKDELYHKTLIVSHCKFVNESEILTSDNISVKIRGIGINPQGYCRIFQSEKHFRIELDNPAWAPAPGQPVVFYRDEKVVGGGFLEKSF